MFAVWWRRLRCRVGLHPGPLEQVQVAYVLHWCHNCDALVEK